MPMPGSTRSSHTLCSNAVSRMSQQLGHLAKNAKSDQTRVEISRNQSLIHRSVNGGLNPPDFGDCRASSPRIVHRAVRTAQRL